MYSAERLSEGVIRANLPFIRKNSWEAWALLLSDIHIDSIKCDRQKLFRLCDQAVARKALILSNGDLYDVMQGYLDPRRAKDLLRPEYMHTDYLNAVMDDGFVLLEPYAENFLLFGDGNHETKVLKHHEVNMTKSLIRDLQRKSKSKIFYGDYRGWVQFSFLEGRTDRKEVGRKVNLYYHHGSGRKSNASRDRMSSEFPDANIIWYGHFHRMDFKFVPRQRLTQKGGIRTDMQMHIETPGFKKCGTLTSGFAAEKGLGPTITGGMWLRFFWNHATRQINFEPQLAL